MKSISQINSYLIGQTTTHIDYWDIYTADLYTNKKINIESAFKEFFLCIPPLANWLFKAREIFVKILGLKTAGCEEDIGEEIKSFKGNVGEKIALFQVLARNENEIFTGQNDTHLDFGLSFYIAKKEGGYLIRLITIVKINNTLGKIYFAFVKPFHILLMPLILHRLKNRLLDA